MAGRSPLTLRDASAEEWQVYADQLLASHAPEARLRGELIRLQLELEHTDGAARQRLVERERELLRREPSLGGPDAVFARLDAIWRRGFVSTVRGPTLEVLRVLLEQPSGSLLDELTLNHPTAPLDEQVELLARSRVPLRVLTVDSDHGGARFEGLIECGQVLRLPSLRRVSLLLRQVGLSAHGEPVSLVEELTLSAQALPFAQLDRWTFPNLVHLEVAAITGVTVFWRSVATGNDTVPPPPLGGAARLAAGQVTPGLRRLVVRNFELDGAGVELLSALAASTPLELLDVRECRVSAATLGRLRALRCQVIA